MLYAYLNDGSKILARPEARAVCPECGEEVIAKCGEINIWHWAHKAAAECDLWGEHETAWHLRWKSKWPADRVEVLIEKDNIKHRADIVTSGGIVIELQHSPISPDEMWQRESFYENMVWLFDVSEPYHEDRLSFRNRNDEYHSFRWKWPRKHLAYAQKESYWDVGARIFLLKKMHLNTRCGGWGYFYDRARWAKKYGAIL